MKDCFPDLVLCRLSAEAALAFARSADESRFCFCRSGQVFIDCLIDQPIRNLIHLARDPDEADGREWSHQLFGAKLRQPQLLIIDLPFAGHLVSDQLAIEHDMEIAALQPELLREPQSADDAFVLGNVVGNIGADIVLNIVPIAIDQELGGSACMPRIAPRAAVRINYDNAHLFRLDLAINPIKPFAQAKRH